MNRPLTEDLVEFAIVTGPTLIAATVFLFGCWRLVDLTATATFTREEERFFWVVFCAWGGWHIIFSGIRRSFRPQQSRRRMLLAIASSYGGLIVAFAGLYYVLAAVSDRAETLVIAQHYREWLNRPKPSEPPAPVDLRAFKGMDSVWTGLDAYIPNRGLDSLTQSDYQTAFEHASSQGVAAIDPVFRPERRWGVLLDCLHFSIATMTTTGFGDITPTRSYSKVVADVQIMAGMTMLIFALGMLFGNWWWREPLEDQRERLRFGGIDFRDKFWHDPLGNLRPRSDIHTQREATAAASCPWCGSPYTVSFQGFPPPSQGQDFDPSDKRIFFIFVLSIASYIVYSVLAPHYLTMLSSTGQRIAAIPAIALVAMVVQIPSSFVATRVRRHREAKWQRKYNEAFDTYLRSWSCETCHNVFIDERAAGGGKDTALGSNLPRQPTP